MDPKKSPDEAHVNVFWVGIQCELIVVVRLTHLDGGQDTFLQTQLTHLLPLLQDDVDGVQKGVEGRVERQHQYSQSHVYLSWYWGTLGKKQYLITRSIQKTQMSHYQWCRERG